MSKDLSPDDLKETAKNCREIGNFLTKRSLILTNELGALVRAGASQADTQAKYDEINATNSTINECFTKAIKLDTKAALNILTSTDVTDAMKAVTCTTDKVKLAVNKLNQIRSALNFVAAFIDLGAALVTLGTTGGASFANIKTLIDKIDKLQHVDLSGLSAIEIKALKQSCL